MLSNFMFRASGKLLACAAAAVSVSGCVSTAAPMAQFKPSTGFSPTLNRSPMDSSIACMSQATSQPGRRPIRLAVGQIKDFTGKFSNEASEGGFKITQGASLMVISALGKLKGVEQVERFDTTVSDQEAALAKAQLIRDPDSVRGEAVRPLTAGMYDGSDYYIVGGVTEANYTLSSGGAELNVSQIGGGSRYYVMNIAADLRLVETKSLHVVKTISVQKQIVGREVETGVFNFLGNYLIDVSAGNKTNEPMQMGVRATLELGTMELLSPLYDNYFEQCRPIAEASFGGAIKPEATKAAPGPTIAPPADNPQARAKTPAQPAFARPAVTEPQPALAPRIATPQTPVRTQTPTPPRTAVVPVSSIPADKTAQAAAPPTAIHTAAAASTSPVSPVPATPVQTTPVRLASAAAPAITPAAAPASAKVLIVAGTPVPNPPEPAAVATSTKDAKAPARYVAQVGAVPSSKAADDLWETLAHSLPKQLAGKQKEVVVAQVNGAAVYRTLVAGFQSRDSAETFCATLSKADKPCFVRG